MSAFRAVAPAGAQAVPAPAPWPHFEPDEVEAAAAVLRSGKVNYWTGDEGRRFEEEFAAYTGRRHAVALANGTLALELALYALGVGPGDEVVTTSRTFIASASAAVMRGATPVIADVDPVSQNMTAETVRAVLTPRTRAIIAVHLAGWPCDMESLMALAEQRGLAVIEDCAQALGAEYRGVRAGAWGHLAAFSFCQDKILTTAGEGGMLVMDDPALWQKAWSYKDHGKSYEAVYEREHPPGFRWLHESFGTNWRLSEVQSAVGRVQLRKLPRWLEARRKNAAVYRERFARLPALRLTEPPEHVLHAYYKYYVFVRPERLRAGWDRDRIVEALAGRGVPCRSGSCSEIYREQAFTDRGWGPVERHRVARELGETALEFLVHPTLSEADVSAYCDAVERVMAEATC
ncbi:MAG TPA: DegT/DnrJ/EryC1/StrS aminotransferase family protein [Trueperaceae bacterium]